MTEHPPTQRPGIAVSRRKLLTTGGTAAALGGVLGVASQPAAFADASTGCCVDITEPPYDVQYTPNGEVPTTDSSEPLNRAINDVAAAGGGTVPIRGRLGIASPIVMKSGVKLEGGGGGPYVMEIPPAPDAASTGTWIFWLGGDGETMVQIGSSDQTEPMRRMVIAGISLYGNNKDVTFFELVSNSTEGPPPNNTKQVRIERVNCAEGARGVRWGVLDPPRPTLQVDNVVFEQCNWYHMSEYAVKTGSANSGDFSAFRHCGFQRCAPPDGAYVDLNHSGSIAFEHCAFGGDGDASRTAFRITSLTNKIIISHCFGEKMQYWIDHTARNPNPVQMIGCVLEDDIRIQSAGSIHSYGSRVRASRIYLEHPESSYFGFGDDFPDGYGGLVVKRDPSAVFRNLIPRKDLVGNSTPYFEGDLLAQPLTSGQFSELNQICVRTGRAAPAWTANTQIGRAIEPSWVPNTSYALGDKITPTWANGLRYTCTKAGTSGDTEPEWKRRKDSGSYEDNTCEWSNPEAAGQSISGTYYRQPTVDNGHVYKAIQSGTAGGSEPAWPTDPGSQVPDGSVIWQETGSTPRIISDWAGGSLVTNPAPATTPGSVVKKLAAYDHNGNPIGYIPVYDEIT